MYIYLDYNNWINTPYTKIQIKDKYIKIDWLIDSDDSLFIHFCNRLLSLAS